jgi:protein tyrosine/serine phosphatase
MKRFRLLPALLLSLLFLLRASSQTPPPPAVMQSASAEKIHIDGIPNAGKINEHLYRGAQPTLAAFAELKNLGVTTIVNLRLEHDQDIAAERRQVESLGLRFVHIPVGGFSAPSNAQVIQFLSIFRDHPTETVFVHCHYGEDRTGVFVASYRMTFQSWPVEQAAKEMNSFSFNRRWQPEMKAFVRDFPARLSSAPDLAQFQKTLTPATPLAPPLPTPQ